MSQVTVGFGPAVEVVTGAGGATFTNAGPATVSYSDSQNVRDAPEGSLAASASATLYGTVFLWAATRADVNYVLLSAPSVGSSRLDLVPAPEADVDLNGFKITDLADPTSAQDAATRAYVLARIDALIAAAPGALDTLDELAAALGDDANFATTITTALATKAAKASNLSDLTNAATARTNLGVAAAGVENVALAGSPDLLIAGAVTRNANGAATSAPVQWPDTQPGTYTAISLSTAFPGAVDAYTITKGSPVTQTFTQAAVTRNATGAVTTRPAITVS